MRGDTGSALELAGNGHNLYVWTTPASGEGEPGESMRLAGTTVTANEVRAWWDVSGLRVWVSGGSTGRLPDPEGLEKLVAASAALPAPG